MHGAMALGARSIRPVALAVVALLAALAFSASAAAPAQAGTACGKWGGDEPSELTQRHARKAVHCLLNRQRAKRGIPRLGRSGRLQTAAQRHTDYMDKRGCFSHVCPGEASLDTRLRSVGYLKSGLSRWSYGENIAWGTHRMATPKAIVKSWMHSPGHRANILNRSFREVGVGYARGTPLNKRDRNGGIYTTDFGLRIG